jgi:protein phosphatase
MRALVTGVQALTRSGLRADFARETVRFNEDGAVKYFGFTDALNREAGAVQIASPMLRELSEVNSFLLRHVFAESSTMRLGDEFSALVLSEEIKAFSQRLRDADYADEAQLVQEFSQLCATGPVRVDAALLSDVGREREVNEDSGLIIRLHRAGHLATYTVDVYVVADGMGGHEGGEVASDLTVRALQRAIEERIEIDWDDNIAVRAAMFDIIEAVNGDVVALTETDRYRGTRAKPGATLVFAIQLGQRVFVGNVGDSRAYKWNAAQGLQRISKDHSYVQTLIDSGSLNEEDAFDHPDGSIITAHIGMQKLRLRDVFVRVFAPGDKLLLVSDGVVDMLRDRDIEPFLHADNSAVVCCNLVDASNAAGGADNITVVCVSFS